MNFHRIIYTVLRKGMIFSAIFFLTITFSCREEGELTPEFNTSGIMVHDTLIGITSSVVESDSSRTDRVSRMLLGKLNDNTFGLSKAEFYTQVSLSSSSFDVPSDVENFDSLILYLVYTDYYGFTGEQPIYIYEVSEDMDVDGSYYSTNSLTTVEKEIGVGKAVLLEGDDVQDSARVLRIRLDDEIKDRIYAAQEFATNADWLSFFKGIKVSTDPSPDPLGDGEGALLYFDLVDPDSKMELHFSSPNGAFTYDFEIEGEAQKFSNLTNSFPESTKLIFGDTTQTINYASSLSGLRTKISFQIPQGLLNQAPISINKAELVIPYDAPIFEQYDPADRLLVVLQSDTGGLALPRDYFKGGSDFFGGKLDLANTDYRFNLSSTIHDVINNENTDLELYISISGNSVTGHRMKLFSGLGSTDGTTTKKIYLILTYSKT